jgi:hypothetical protein
MAGSRGRVSGIGQQALTSREWHGWLAIVSRRTANIVAGVLVLVVAGIGVAVIVKDSKVTAPESKTTVTKGATEAVPASRKTTTETVRKGGKAVSTTTTVEAQSATPKRAPQTTETTQAGERTFLERVLGDGGLVGLQVGVVLLAAFLAGALLQKVLLGDYSIKIGSLELAAVADASLGLIKAVDTLRADVDALKGLADHLADTKDDIGLVYKRLELIEKQLKP